MIFFFFRDSPLNSAIPPSLLATVKKSQIRGVNTPRRIPPRCFQRSKKTQKTERADAKNAREEAGEVIGLRWLTRLRASCIDVFAVGTEASDANSSSTTLHWLLLIWLDDAFGIYWDDRKKLCRVAIPLTVLAISNNIANQQAFWLHGNSGFTGF